MKIVQVIPFFTLAGAEIMCENLINELIKNGHQVVVISLYDKKCKINERLESKGVKIYYLNKKRGFDITIVSKIKKVLKIEKPQVVHTHLNAITYAVPASIMAKIKVKVHTVHNVASKDGGRISRFINKYFFKRKKVIPVALSELVQKTIVDEYGLDKTKVPVVYNGINLQNLKAKDNYTSSGDFTFIHVGRFEKQKNHIGLLKAFKFFNEKYQDTKLQLIGDGRERENILQFINDNNLSSKVEVLGVKDNVYDYLYNADAFVLPSLFEGMPITLIEAMGTGLPIIASKVGGIPDMIENDVSGVITSLDEAELVASLYKVYSDEDFRAKIGKNALKISDKFSSKTMAINYQDIYGRGNIDGKGY